MSLCSISFGEGSFENLPKKVHVDLSHEIKFAVINKDWGEEKYI
jgi:hypothetical protein